MGSMMRNFTNALSLFTFRGSLTDTILVHKEGHFIAKKVLLANLMLNDVLSSPKLFSLIDMLSGRCVFPARVFNMFVFFF